MDGRGLAAELKDQFAAVVADHKRAGVVPELATRSRT